MKKAVMICGKVKIMKIVEIDVKNIKPYSKNAKKHPKEQVEQIVESIKEFGFIDPIGIWSDENIIVEGHGRYEALKKLKYKTVPCIRLDHLTDEQRKAYTLAHNKLTMNTDFDLDVLASELNDIPDLDMSLFGFDIDSVEEDPEVVEDEVPELEEETTAKLGDIWQLGRHRVLCADSTDGEQVGAFMDGIQADLVVTDPPYNVDYERKEKLLSNFRQNKRVEEKQKTEIKNDSMDNDSFRQFLVDAFSVLNKNLKPGGAFYIWHAPTEEYNFSGACLDVGWKIRQCLIWNKNAMVMGRQDYHWKHEPCLYGWKDGAGHYFVDDRTQTTVHEDQTPDFKKMNKAELVEFCKEAFGDKISTSVINENRPARNADHPTMKPIKLLARLVKNSSRQGEVVVDTFGGSGSTLITCEQLNRTCYTVELDPRYVDVIIKRYENLTGDTAVKIK